MPEALDLREVSRVAGHQIQPVFEGDGRDHRIREADRRTRLLEVGQQHAGRFGGRTIDAQYLGSRQPAEDGPGPMRRPGAQDTPDTTSMTVIAVIVRVP